MLKAKFKTVLRSNITSSSEYVPMDTKGGVL